MKTTPKCDKCNDTGIIEIGDTLVLYPVSIYGIGTLHVCDKCFQEVEEIREQHKRLLNSELLTWYTRKEKKMKVKCSNCKGTGVIDPCPRCKGTGEVEHDCKASKSLEEIVIINKMSDESLGIYLCKGCGQLWKIRFQYDPGTGSDHIWMKPGEEKRYYVFSKEEAELIDQILKAATVSELPQGWTDCESHIRKFVMKRMRELQSI
jgi:RecJ-like exonuclease